VFSGIRTAFREAPAKDQPDRKHGGMDIVFLPSPAASADPTSEAFSEYGTLGSRRRRLPVRGDLELPSWPSQDPPSASSPAAATIASAITTSSSITSSASSSSSSPKFSYPHACSCSFRLVPLIVAAVAIVFTAVAAALPPAPYGRAFDNGIVIPTVARLDAVRRDTWERTGYNGRHIYMRYAHLLEALGQARIHFGLRDDDTRDDDTAVAANARRASAASARRARRTRRTRILNVGCGYGVFDRLLFEGLSKRSSARPASTDATDATDATDDGLPDFVGIDTAADEIEYSRDQARATGYSSGDSAGGNDIGGRATFMYVHHNISSVVAGGAAEEGAYSSLQALHTVEAKAPFDVIIFSEVAEHIPRAQLHQTLDTMDQWLAPGGTVLLTVPNRLTLRNRARAAFTAISAFASTSLSAFAAVFSPMSQERTHTHPTHPTYPIVKMDPSHVTRPHRTPPSAEYTVAEIEDELLASTVWGGGTRGHDARYRVVSPPGPNGALVYFPFEKSAFGSWMTTVVLPVEGCVRRALAHWWPDAACHFIYVLQKPRD
jgi:SAM-dependent methyltransferase